MSDDRILVVSAAIRPVVHAALLTRLVWQMRDREECHRRDPTYTASDEIIAQLARLIEELAR